MTKEELLAGLGFLATQEVPSVELFILGKPVENAAGQTDIDIYKGRMQQELPGQIRQLFYPKIRRVLVTKEYELLSYDPALNPDRNVVWQYPSADVPFYNLIIQRLPGADDHYYDDTLLPYSDIWAVWIKLSIRDTNFYILKRITPSKVLTTGGVLAWVFEGETFTKLNSDILTIDGTFDVLVCNNILIFENKQNFEKALQYEEIMQAAANETLEN
ncbi:MAG TPA: Kiwa anti-phage protein KwaB-like domain-containing protein, partial [Bacteroidia bacterium]|nr:Kiwa anti-phage protein KwaB-like domain-containing protein [Bacteroidia bacterium]